MNASIPGRAMIAIDSARQLCAKLVDTLKNCGIKKGQVDFYFDLSCYCFDGILCG
jgi:hypothetical protein